MASKRSTNLPPISGPNFLFEVNYFKCKDLPAGTCITSPTFTAGGYDWALNFNAHEVMHEWKDLASLFLSLKTEAVKDITAEYSFRLLKDGNFMFVFGKVDDFTNSGNSAGSGRFFTRNYIEYFHSVDGIITISCSIYVVTEKRDIPIYPGGLCEHMGKLWEKGERSDVIFEVEGESISAHRLILATRSPVFEAELYGSMAEAKMACIKVEEMKVEVFKALLHFIYTDQIAKDGSSDHQTLSVELVQGLLVAADRYALGKLSLLCEERLAESFSVDTVATTLLLADRHSCVGLKKKCLDFVSDPENFLLVALTGGYLQIMQEASTLFAKLSEMVKGSMKKFEKKQKLFNI